MGWEKLEGYDSNIFLAQWTPYGEDFVAPPFDVALSQAVEVAPGGEYSLSAWMTSLCGGSADPNCPAGAYIAKMAGLDPTGGTDPLAGTVEWTEDRRSHYEARWANLIVATTAQASTLTVFMRVNSPFTYHGNTAYADAVKLVRSPSSKFTGLGLGFKSISVSWDGSLGPDIPAIPGTKHELAFELQVRTAGGAWQPWLSGQPVGSAAFAPPLAGQGKTYQFRIRAWAIQPPGSHGSWPDHHFVGVWHESAEIYMPVMEERPPVSLFLPLTAR
jgi:hypothetical protein